MSRRIHELTGHERKDIAKISVPGARALFEAASEMLPGGANVPDNYRTNRFRPEPPPTGFR